MSFYEATHVALLAAGHVRPEGFGEAAALALHSVQALLGMSGVGAVALGLRGIRKPPRETVIGAAERAQARADANRALAMEARAAIGSYAPMLDRAAAGGHMAHAVPGTAGADPAQWYVRRDGSQVYEDMDAEEFSRFRSQVASNGGTLTEVMILDRDPAGSEVAVRRYVGGSLDGDTEACPAILAVSAEGVVRMSLVSNGIHQSTSNIPAGGLPEGVLSWRAADAPVTNAFGLAG